LGLTVNVWPLLLVGALGFLPVGPAVKATAKPAGAILFFAVAWGIAIWQSFERSIGLGFAMIALLPISLAALLFASERVVRIAKAGRQWIRSRKIDDIGDQVVVKRAAVRDAVRSVEPRGADDRA
jgi:hypothetical protein